MKLDIDLTEDQRLKVWGTAIAAISFVFGYYIVAPLAGSFGIGSPMPSDVGFRGSKGLHWTYSDPRGWIAFLSMFVCFLALLFGTHKATKLFGLKPMPWSEDLEKK
jgi:hypothetical protein